MNDRRRKEALQKDFDESHHHHAKHNKRQKHLQFLTWKSMGNKRTLHMCGPLE
jgi:hypothetical protein